MRVAVERAGEKGGEGRGKGMRGTGKREEKDGMIT